VAFAEHGLVTRARWRWAYDRWGFPDETGHLGLVASVLAALFVGLAATAMVVLIGPTVALTAIVGVVAVGAVAKMPGVLLAAYLLIPFYKGAVQPYLPIDITLILAAANALQIIPVILDGRLRQASPAGVAAWIGLASLVLAGTLWAADQALALSTALTFWLLVCLPLLAAGLRVGSDERYLRQLLWAFFGMGALTVVLGVFNVSTSSRLVILGMNTIQVSLAAFLVPLVGVTFVLREGLTPVKAVTVALIPAAFVVAIASGSRGPLLLLVLMGGAALVRQVIRPRGVSRRMVAAVAGTIVVAVVAASVFSDVIPVLSIQRFTLFGDFLQNLLSGDSITSARDTSSADRVRLFGMAAAIFADHPLLGSGPAGFEVLSPLYAGLGPGDRYPHNAVLQFAAEFGIIGVAAFVGLALAAITRRTPSDPAWAAVRVLLVFFLLNSMISGDILENRMLWGLLGLVLLFSATRPSVPMLTTRAAAVGQPTPVPSTRRAAT
jgi:O-antigen ligase